MFVKGVSGNPGGVPRHLMNGDESLFRLVHSMQLSPEVVEMIELAQEYKNELLGNLDEQEASARK